MDKIWYRNPSKLEVIGRCGAEPTKVSDDCCQAIFNLAYHQYTLIGQPLVLSHSHVTHWVNEGIKQMSYPNEVVKHEQLNPLQNNSYQISINKTCMDQNNKHNHLFTSCIFL